MYSKKKTFIEFCICLVDAFILVLSLIIAELIRYKSFAYISKQENFHVLVTVAILIHLGIYYLLDIFGDYRGFFKRNRYQELVVSLKYNLFLVTAIELLSFMLKQEIFVSRLVMGYFFIINTIIIYISHIVIRNKNRILNFSERKKTNLFLVTSKKDFKDVKKEIESSKDIAWNICGVILLDNKDDTLKEIESIPVIENKEDVYLEFLAHNIVDEAFIFTKYSAPIEKMIEHFSTLNIVIDIYTDLASFGIYDENLEYHFTKINSLNAIMISNRRYDYRAIIIKRIFDIIGAIVGMILTLIIGIIIAPFLLIESPGSLIFKQKRVGVNGRIFDFYKFRSMYPDAEERKKELLSQNEMQGLMFKMEDDPRITKVGKFLRKTSLDEFPQFFNVLKGDMSLVGTRPPTIDEYEQYTYYQKSRLSFRPGITGLWQVSGRNNITNFDDVVKLDLDYISHWSLGLDVKILLKTIKIVFNKSGAR